MNGQAFTGGADDAPPVPPWRVPFGNKAGEATRRGFSRLTLALAHGRPEQVGNCSRNARLQRHPRGNTHGCLFRQGRLFLVAVIPRMCFVHDMSRFLKWVELRVHQMGTACLHPALQHGDNPVPFSHGTLQPILPNHLDHT
ncbi:solute carrier family 14 member 1 (Kidd blood group) [Phyllostomus discolor]|uniref:Solute carrier family 14 member 1 (Kidd blood group) n=1 Tax=Phyllostomus discolor TaxID=89673 RepID=A0A833ZAZ6_9CHIR|nr:solute carrier family 14 member 1 (Kidd blood group) [Phyllostomus discolor]